MSALQVLFHSCSADENLFADLPEDYPLESPETVTEWQAVFGYAAPPPARVSSFPDTRFMTLSDIHYMDPSLVSEGEAFSQFTRYNDGKLLRRGTAYLEMIVASVIDENPDFLLISGDLTVNGAEASHMALADSLEEIRLNGIPVFVIPGNHDINNPWAASFEDAETRRVGGISPDRFREIYSNFGYSLPRQGPGDSLAYIADPVENLEIIMIDTSLYQENEELGYPQVEGFLPDNQVRWIREALKKASETRTEVMVVMHHSLLHHVGNGGGTMNSITVYEWPLYFELFAEAGVPLVFSGHIHAQDTAAMALEKGGYVYDIATGSAAVFPHLSRIVEIKDNTARLSSRRLTDSLPEDIRDEWISFSRETYLHSMLDRTAGRISEEFEVSDQKARIMMSYIAALSLNHFSGEEQGDLPPESFTEARRLWAKAGGADKWLNRMADDTAPKDNNILINLDTGLWKSD